MRGKHETCIAKRKHVLDLQSDESICSIVFHLTWSFELNITMISECISMRTGTPQVFGGLDTAVSCRWEQRWRPWCVRILRNTNRFCKAPDEIFDTFAFCWLRLEKREGFYFFGFWENRKKWNQAESNNRVGSMRPFQGLDHVKGTDVTLHVTLTPITLSVASCVPTTEVGSGYVIQAPSTSVRPIGSPKEARWIYSFWLISIAWNLSASFAFGHHGITQWKHVPCLSKAFGALETQVTWTNQCVSIPSAKRQRDFHFH